jgi:hypothetical protein
LFAAMPNGAKHWCFTINNYTNEHKEHLALLFQGVDQGNPSSIANYLVYGEEVGENGTPHLQGFISFTKRTTFNQCKSHVGTTAHIEVAKGSPAQNRTYCTKEGAFTEFGKVPKSAGSRTDLAAFATAIKEGKNNAQLFDLNPAAYLRYRKWIDKLRDDFVHQPRDINKPPRVVVLWGHPGTGKTRFVYDQHEHNDIWSWPGDRWFDGYNGQRVALFDDFNGAAFPIQFLLKILDRYPRIVPVKGDFVQWSPDYIYFTSNLDPTEWYAGANERNQVALQRRIDEVKYFAQ